MVVGPRRKPPIIKLMARFGENSWYWQTDKPEGQNNCKDIWNKR